MILAKKCIGKKFYDKNALHISFAIEMHYKNYLYKATPSYQGHLCIRSTQTTFAPSSKKCKGWVSCPMFRASQ